MHNQVLPQRGPFEVAHLPVVSISCHKLRVQKESATNELVNGTVTIFLHRRNDERHVRGRWIWTLARRKVVLHSRHGCTTPAGWFHSASDMVVAHLSWYIKFPAVYCFLSLCEDYLSWCRPSDHVKGPRTSVKLVIVAVLVRSESRFGFQRRWGCLFTSCSIANRVEVHSPVISTWHLSLQTFPCSVSTRHLT